MQGLAAVKRICSYTNHIELREKQYEELKRQIKAKAASFPGKIKDENTDNWKKRMLEKLHAHSKAANG